MSVDTISAAVNKVDLLAAENEQYWEEIWNPLEEQAVTNPKQKKGFEAFRTDVREAVERDLQIEALRLFIYLHRHGVEVTPRLQGAIQDGEHREAVPVEMDG